jgi:hypothetical protein
MRRDEILCPIVRRRAHRETFDVEPLSTARTTLLLPGALRTKPISTTVTGSGCNLPISRLPHASPPLSKGRNDAFAAVLQCVMNVLVGSKNRGPSSKAMIGPRISPRSRHSREADLQYPLRPFIFLTHSILLPRIGGNFQGSRALS